MAKSNSSGRKTPAATKATNPVDAKAGKTDRLAAARAAKAAAAASKKRAAAAAPVAAMSPAESGSDSDDDATVALGETKAHTSKLSKKDRALRLMTFTKSTVDAVVQKHRDVSGLAYSMTDEFRAGVAQIADIYVWRLSALAAKASIDDHRLLDGSLPHAVTHGAPTSKTRTTRARHSSRTPQRTVGLKHVEMALNTINDPPYRKILAMAGGKCIVGDTVTPDAVVMPPDVQRRPASRPKTTVAAN